MNGNIKLTAALVICSTVALCAVGGCAKRNDKVPAARTRQALDDGTFAAGAGRAPTAATAFGLAKILVSQGRDRDALYVLSNIVREHPKHLPAYNEMAGVYVRADRLDDAIAALKAGLEQSPADGVLHNNLGMCYLLKEDPARALESFTRATEAVPNSATFRANRAAALALTAHDAESESEYRTIVGTIQARENVKLLARARQSEPLPEPATQAPSPSEIAPIEVAPSESTPAAAPAAEPVHVVPAPAAAETDVDDAPPAEISTSFDVLRDLEISEQSDYYPAADRRDVAADSYAFDDDEMVE